MNAYSDAQSEARFGVGNGIQTHLSGDDDAMMAFMENTLVHDATVPDIDVHSNFNVNVSEDWTLSSSGSGKSTVFVMDISGSISGDGFSSAESFESDKSGNRVFLGVFATSKNRGPFQVFQEIRKWA